MVRLCVPVPPVCVAAGHCGVGSEPSVRPIPPAEEADLVQPDDRGVDGYGHVRIARSVLAFPWFSLASLEINFLATDSRGFTRINSAQLWPLSVALDIRSLFA